MVRDYIAESMNFAKKKIGSPFYHAGPSTSLRINSGGHTDSILFSGFPQEFIRPGGFTLIFLARPFQKK